MRSLPPLRSRQYSFLERTTKPARFVGLDGLKKWNKTETPPERGFSGCFMHVHFGPVFLAVSRLNKHKTGWR